MTRRSVAFVLVAMMCREPSPEVCPIGYAQTEVRSDDANHARSCI